MIPGLDSCKPKVVTTPTLPASQEEVKYLGKEPDGIGGKNSTPLQGLIFSKSHVHGYGQLLGINVEIIENLNLN